MRARARAGLARKVGNGVSYRSGPACLASSSAQCCPAASRIWATPWLRPGWAPGSRVAHKDRGVGLSVARAGRTKWHQEVNQVPHWLIEVRQGKYYGTHPGLCRHLGAKGRCVPFAKGPCALAPVDDGSLGQRLNFAVTGIVLGSGVQKPCSTEVHVKPTKPHYRRYRNPTPSNPSFNPRASLGRRP